MHLDNIIFPIAGILIVIAIIKIIIDSFSGNRELIRCQRCGYRGHRGEFANGRCPGCSSHELS